MKKSMVEKILHFLCKHYTINGNTYSRNWMITISCFWEWRIQQLIFGWHYIEDEKGSSKKVTRWYKPKDS